MTLADLKVQARKVSEPDARVVAQIKAWQEEQCGQFTLGTLRRALERSELEWLVQQGGSIPSQGTIKGLPPPSSHWGVTTAGLQRLEEEDRKNRLSRARLDAMKTKESP